MPTACTAHQPLPKSSSTRSKRWLATTFLAALVACGESPSPGNTTASADVASTSASVQAFAGAMRAMAASPPPLDRRSPRLMSTLSALNAAAVEVGSDQVLDWAEFKFPELFPKAGVQKFPSVVYESVTYNARAYSGAWGTRYLGITPGGAIFGLGDFTNNQLQGFGVIADYAAQVSADACSTNPAGCTNPGLSSDYLVYGTSKGADGVAKLNVVDPANPGSVLLSTAYTEFSNMTTVALSIDASTRNYTRKGEPLLFFVRDRQLFKVAMRKPGTPHAVRVSSRVDVCALYQVTQLGPGGDDAWLWMGTAGVNGVCDGVDDGMVVARSSADNNAAGTLMPRGVSPLGNPALYDRTGQLLWMLVHDRGGSGGAKVAAYSAALVRAEIAGGALADVAAPLSAGVPGAGPALADGPFMRLDTQLRRLTGDFNGLSLAPSVYTFTSTFSGLGLADGTTQYFPDAHKLVRVQGAAAAGVFATLPQAEGDISGLSQTAGHIVLNQRRRTQPNGASIWSVNKSNGQTLRLVAGTAPNKIPEALGLWNETVYYGTDERKNKPDLKRIQTDGSGDALQTTGVIPVGGILRTRGRADFTQFFFGSPTQLLYCTPTAAAADCRSGTLHQLDMATQQVTALGNFADNQAPVWRAQALGWDGQAGTVITAHGSGNAAQPGYDRSDMWVVNPGQANSLRRVTTHMP